MLQVVNDVFPQLVTQLPSAAAVIVVVMIFVKFLGDQQKINRDFFHQLHEAHLQAREEMIRKLSDTAEAARENVVATTRNTGMLADLSRAIDRMDKR